MKKLITLVLFVVFAFGVVKSASAQEFGRIETLMHDFFTKYDMSDISYVVIFQDNKDQRGSSKILVHGCTGKVGELYTQYLSPGVTITYSVTYPLPGDLKQAVVQAVEKTEVPIFAGGLFGYYASILGSEDGILWIWKNGEKIVCPGDDNDKIPPLPGKGQDKDKGEFLHELGDVMTQIGEGETFEEEWYEPLPEEEPIPELAPNYQLPSGPSAMFMQAGSTTLVILMLAFLLLSGLFLFLRPRRS